MKILLLPVFNIGVFTHSVTFQKTEECRAVIQNSTSFTGSNIAIFSTIFTGTRMLTCKMLEPYLVNNDLR